MPITVAGFGLDRYQEAMCVWIQIGCTDEAHPEESPVP